MEPGGVMLAWELTIWSQHPCFIFYIRSGCSLKPQMLRGGILAITKLPWWHRNQKSISKQQFLLPMLLSVIRTFTLVGFTLPFQWGLKSLCFVPGRLNQSHIKVIAIIGIFYMVLYLRLCTWKAEPHNLILLSSPICVLFVFFLTLGVQFLKPGLTRIFCQESSFCILAWPCGSFDAPFGRIGWWMSSAGPLAITMPPVPVSFSLPSMDFTIIFSLCHFVAWFRSGAISLFNSKKKKNHIFRGLGGTDGCCLLKRPFCPTISGQEDLWSSFFLVRTLIHLSQYQGSTNELTSSECILYLGGLWKSSPFYWKLEKSLRGRQVGIKVSTNCGCIVRLAKICTFTQQCLFWLSLQRIRQILLGPFLTGNSRDWMNSSYKQCALLLICGRFEIAFAYSRNHLFNTISLRKVYRSLTTIHKVCLNNSTRDRAFLWSLQERWVEIVPGLHTCLGSADGTHCFLVDNLAEVKNLSLTG